MEIKIKLLRNTAIVPKYQTKWASGFDIASCVDVEIMPNETVIVPTGYAVELPGGFEMQIRPRSGMSLKTPIRIANSPGTIDSDYRGEIGIICTNTGNEMYKILRGEKIAQGVITQYERITWDVVEELTETERGKGGFGHTGKTYKL